MALFGSLFGGNNTNPNTMSLKEDKKKKKKGKDNEELAYDNPAFQIYDPGSSFNAQSGFINQEQQTAPPATAPIVEQPATPQATIDPAAIAAVVSAQPTVPPTTVEQLELDQQVNVIGGEQVASQDINRGQEVTNYNNTVPGSEGSTIAPTTDPEDKNKRVARPVRRYRYTIINGVGKKEQGTFEAETEAEVRNFLQMQDYQVLEVKERSKSDIDIGGNGKISASDLSFSLTQLSTYLRAGIPLSDSVRILAKQSRKANLKHHYNQLVYQLLKGENLSDAMEMQGKVFPKLLINMVKTAEMTGDLPSILDDMAEYYTSMEQTRKQMKSAMTYPAVVLTIAIGVLIFMLTYLVPQFTSMFEDQGAELPALTKAIVGVSGFIIQKWYWLLIGVAAVIAIFYLLFTKVQGFRKAIQIILMHMPVTKDVIIYNEMANFSKTFASLLNHSVFITDSMEILSKITENEVYKGIINKTLENLAKGDSISSAFRGEWAIPVVAYEMIVTGESTGQLGAMMEKVAAHFQMLHKNVIDQMKSLIEPIMIVFLAAIVGVILVSIIQPMFSIYSQIK